MSQTADEPTPEQIAAEDEALGPCEVGGGMKSEHKNRIHAFTKAGGDLITHAQAKKRESAGKPMVIRTTTPNGSTLVSRLVERLHDKGVFDDDDILFITGIKGSGDTDGASS